MSLHLTLLLTYSALQVALGLWIGRRVKSAGDFFVAGRGLGPGLVFATFVAANIGAGSTVGAAGLGYRDGLSAWWWGRGSAASPRPTTCARWATSSSTATTAACGR